MGWFGTTVGAPLNWLLRAVAKRAWVNGGRWEEVILASTSSPWLVIGQKPMPRRSTLSHLSANRLLERNALVNHWLPRIDKDVDAMILKKYTILCDWGHIEHRAFWQRLKPRLSQPHASHTQEKLYWVMALDAAAGCGNIEPFLVAPRQMIHEHVGRIGVPHPCVGKWLLAHGFLTLERWHEKIDRAYSMKRPSFMAEPSFGGQSDNGPMTPDYVAQWCVQLLRDVGLSQAQRIGVVGQAVLAFGQDAWEKYLASVCAPYIEDIDMDLVYAMCSPRGCIGPVERMVGSVVALALQDLSELHIPKGSKLFHEGLELLLELAPPKNRIELYFLAKTAKDADAGLVQAPEMLALPALD